MYIWEALVTIGLICSIIGILISTVGLIKFYLWPWFKGHV